MTADIADTLVVGSGIVGAAVALRLAHDRRRVHLFAPADRVGGATDASGAMLGVLGETTPEELPAEAALRLAAWQRYPAWLETVEHPISRGTFVIAGAEREHDVRAIDAMQRAAALSGLRAERVAPEDVPCLDCAPGHALRAVLFLADEAWVDGPSLCRAAQAAALRSGRVTLVPDQVDTVVHRNGVVRGVRTRRGDTYTGEHVVVCVGAAVPALLERSGLDAGLVPRIMAAKGVGLLLSGPAERTHPYVLRTPNRQFACGLHVVPRSAGSVYVGSTNSVGARAPGTAGAATAGEVSRLLDGAIREFSASLAEYAFTATMYGVRPLSADGLPVAGRTAMAGLSVATGTYRNGVLLAPLMADTIAAELDNAEPAAASVNISPRRLVAAVDVPAVLRRGLAELVEHWRYDPSSRWPDVVGPLLDRLASLALHADAAAVDELRTAVELVAEHGRPEMVPEAVRTLIGDRLP